MIETNEAQIRAVFLEWYATPSLTEWASTATPLQKAEAVTPWFIRRLAELGGTSLAPTPSESAGRET